MARQYSAAMSNNFMKAAGPHISLGAVARICSVLVVPFFTVRHVKAAEPPAPTAVSAPVASVLPVSAQIPAGPPQISYAGGQLTIHALNASLSDVLAKVAALIGISIDLPDGAANEAMPILLLGPAPAREVLASLLGGAHFDYVMQASEADPDKLQSLLIMLRKKPGSDPAAADSAITPLHSPFVKIPSQVAASDDAEAPSTAAGAQAAAAASSDSQAQSTPVEASSEIPLSQHDPVAAPKTAPLSPPATLTPDSMNQQLQQMYQQRMLMTQQEHAAASATH